MSELEADWVSSDVRDRDGGLARAAMAELSNFDHAGEGSPDRAAQWMRTYLRAASEATSAADLDPLVIETVAAAARATNAHTVSLFFVDDDGSDLTLSAQWALDEEAESSSSGASARAAARRVYATGSPIVLDDLAVAPERAEDRSSGQRTFVGVPLLGEGRAVGVLYATRETLARFNDDDAAALASLADPVAVACARVRRFERERAARLVAEEAIERAERSASHVQSLLRISAALASAATITQICEVIIDEAAPNDADGGERAIWMLRDSHLLLVAGRGLSAEYPEIPLDPTLPAAENLRDGRPLFVESKAELAERWPVLADTATRSFAGLPLIVEGRRLGVIAVGFRTEHRFEPDEREYLTAIAEQAAAALARADEREALEWARRVAEERQGQLDYLAEASRRLGESLNLDVTLQTVADLGVPHLTDRCVLFLLEGTTIAKRVLAPELNEDERRLFEQLTPTLSALRGVGAVIRTGVPEHIGEINDAALVASAQTLEELDLLRRVGFGASLILPLRARGRTVGALAFVNRAGRTFSDEDRSLAVELAARAAVAIDNALLYRRESHVARRLTESLLPARIPVIDGIDVGVRYVSGSVGLDVGGDFYDVVPIDSSSWLVVVGDVQGKGVEAAAMTGLARHTIRAAAHYESSPAELLRHLNRALFHTIESAASEYPWDAARLCTAALVRLDCFEQQWTMTSCAAGHPLPLVSAHGRPAEDFGTSNLILGVLEDSEYVESTRLLDGGDRVVLYTDGVSESSYEHRLGADGIAAVIGRSHGSAS
ncbi:MAG TPA: GAF domain-containing protein, partial [Acidimicrobiales bacterium]|nr:GAF domain-containing protein [Acidimicrobiales bacterium]